MKVICLWGCTEESYDRYAEHDTSFSGAEITIQYHEQYNHWTTVGATAPMRGMEPGGAGEVKEKKEWQSEEESTREKLKMKNIWFDQIQTKLLI